MLSPAVSFESDAHITASSSSSPQSAPAVAPPSPATSAGTPPDVPSPSKARQGSERKVAQSDSRAEAEAAEEKEEEEQEEDNIPTALLPILESYQDLARGRRHSERDLTFHLTPTHYRHLRRILEVLRPPAYLEAARFAVDKARECYDPTTQILRIRMTLPIHDQLARNVIEEILNKLQASLRNHPRSDLAPVADRLRADHSRSLHLHKGGDSADQSPDQTIGFRDAHYPGFVLEACFSHVTDDETIEKYFEWSEHNIRAVLRLSIGYKTPDERRADPDDYSMTISLWRLGPATPDADGAPSFALEQVLSEAPLADDDRELILLQTDFSETFDSETTIAISHGDLRSHLAAAAHMQSKQDLGEIPKPKYRVKKRKREEDTQAAGGCRADKRRENGKSAPRRTSIRIAERSRVEGQNLEKG